MSNVTTTQQLLKNLPVAIVFTTADNEVTWANDAATKLIGHDNATPLSADAQSLFQTCITSDSPFNIPATDCWLACQAFALNDKSGQQAYLLEDISATQQAELALARLNPVDALTGLASETGLIQGLETLLALSRRYEKPLAILLLEAGNIAEFSANSRPSVDDVLLGLARKIKEQTRWADLIGRYNENQFMLVLPETTLADAEKLADKLIPQLAQITVIQAPNQPIDLHINYGLAEYTKGDDCQRMVRRCLSSLQSSRTSSISGEAS